MMTDAATPGTATASEDPTLAAAARAIERFEDRRRRSADDESIVGGGDGGGREYGSVAQATVTADDELAEAAEDAESSEGESDDNASPDEPRYRVKVDGEEAEVPLRELVQGYQRGADYTRKTMRLADERREVEELRALVEDELVAAATERQTLAEQAAGAIPALQAQLATFGGVDWQRLAVEQPAVHAQARMLFDSLSQQLQQAESAQVEAAAAAELQQHRSAEEQRRYISSEKQALMASVPEMADPAQAPREAAALHRYLAESGYAPTEIARLVDHRDFVLARKAMLYDRLMASSAKGREKLAAAGRVLPPGAAPERRTGTKERRAKLMTRLTRSGSTDDAAKLIETMI
ncbi:MAG: hypothetical protein ACKVP5_17265 [Aestuariivirga sp.]